VLYFYIHPRFPEFHLDHIALSQVKLKNVSGDLLLSSQFDAVVEVTNKNTVLRFRYDDFNITVWASGTKDKDMLLGRGMAPGFEQGQRNVTLIRSKISVQSEVVDANMAEDVVDKMKGGELAVAVEVATGVEATFGDWNVIKVLVHLLCKGVDAGDAKSGSNPSCRLDLFRT
jgi:Late embryogenesis abundant protein